MDQVVAQNAVPSNDNTATSTSDEIIFLTLFYFYYIISRGFLPVNKFYSVKDAFNYDAFTITELK